METKNFEKASKKLEQIMTMYEDLKNKQAQQENNLKVLEKIIFEQLEGKSGFVLKNKGWIKAVEKDRKSTSWKSACMDACVPKNIIEKYTRRNKVKKFKYSFSSSSKTKKKNIQKQNSTTDGETRLIEAIEKFLAKKEI